MIGMSRKRHKEKLEKLTEKYDYSYKHYSYEREGKKLKCLLRELKRTKGASQ